MTLNVLANIDVDDLARATEFYCSALELRIGRRFGTSAVELLGGSVPIYLLEKAAGTVSSPGAPSRRHYERHWTPVHLDFVVVDVLAAVARATHAGASLEGQVHTHPWGRIAFMADPFGHGFCFIEFLGRGYDEIAS
ncbi:MAG: VOC family protein [Gammaproteobacteria bacterium]|nr:VOC family protein [Gammaproteobacteria bacterium]MBV9695395.1 VOC family protein [Gammaproteobacteria bacterium]